MEISNEHLRKAFSERLANELSRMGLYVGSPTQIAREFRRQYPDKPVTPQTVRKWLQAEALPTQDKLMALARWLGVSAQWLRFGSGQKWEPEVAVDADNQTRVLVLGKDADWVMKLVAQLPQLSPQNRVLLEGMVQLMLAQQNEPRA